MKFWKLNLAILIGIVLVIGLASYLQPAPTVVAEPLAISVRPHVPFLVHYSSEETADAWDILIDLSDRTNFPHFNTNRIILKALDFSGSQGASKEWHPYVGVVVSTTTSNASLEWIHWGVITSTEQFNYERTLPEHGLNLMVSGNSLAFVATNQITTTVAISSGTYMSSTGAVSTTIGVGDLVLFLDEVTDGATLRFSVDTAYDTE